MNPPKRAVLRALKRGNGLIAAAGELGITPIALNALCEHHRIDRAPYRAYGKHAARRASPRRTQIAALWEQGFSSAEIAEQAGVSRQRVSQVLFDLGLPVTRPVISLKDARSIARNQGIRRAAEYREFARAANIRGLPVYPELAYRDCGWVSWRAFLGTQHLTRGGFPSFWEARRQARQLGCAGQVQWRQWGKAGKIRELGLPLAPAIVYALKGWVSWQDWLGNENKKGHRHTRWLPWAKARKLARTLGLVSERAWIEAYEARRLPPGLGRRPDIAFKEQWAGWADFLGARSERPRPRARV